MLDADSYWHIAHERREDAMRDASSARLVREARLHAAGGMAAKASARTRRSVQHVLGYRHTTTTPSGLAE